MRGQLESLHNHWDLAWPQLPWGTTDASDRTKPQQYSKVSTCEGCSFNLPFTHPVCASVKELGTDLHTLLSNPEHLTLGREKKQPSRPCWQTNDNNVTLLQARSWNSISLTSGNDGLLVCICQWVDRAGLSSRASWNGSFTRNDTMTYLILVKHLEISLGFTITGLSSILATRAVTANWSGKLLDWPHAKYSCR